MPKVPLLDLQAQYIPIRAEIRRAIDEVCDNQNLILGSTVERFEKSLAEYCGTKYALGVSSGTDALLCSLMAMGIGGWGGMGPHGNSEDEVIVPAFTFFATAGCVTRTGAKVVFADVDPETFNLDPAKLEKHITPRTKAVIPVHLFGQVARMEEINEIACRHDLLVLEDAAQAIGAKRLGKPACSIGYAGCLSFYPTKNLGAFGDAGAICSNDPAFIEKCRQIRVHGSAHTYHHTVVGGMFRLDAIQAAVLNVKLKYLDSWHDLRRKHAAIYNRVFAGTKVKAPKIEEGNWSIYNQYVVRVENRDAVKAKLTELGIGTAIYYPIPLHLQECYKFMGHREGDFPISEQACREVLALPVYPELSEEHVEYVAKSIVEVAG